MREEYDVPLARLTTLRLGGAARRVLTAESEREILDAVRSVDEAGEPLLVLGGGSNVVAPDAGFDGTVVNIASRGIDVDGDACSGATVTVSAGEPWGELVDRAVDEGWVGIEALAGIPGLSGATPLQNVGAYGQEVAQTIARVRTWDRGEQRIRTFPNVDCAFAYRTSRFKTTAVRGTSRYVVLEVAFQLRLGDLGEPVRYAELARSLGLRVGERAPLREVHDAVLALRRAKGMVLDETDHDTWSVGSFFTNPVLAPADAERLPPQAPRFPQPDGKVKTSAAWLIEQAGFHRGYRTGGVGLSTKHTLALTNRGGGQTAELLALAREIRRGVSDRFGLQLVNEPVVLGAPGDIHDPEDFAVL